MNLPDAIEGEIGQEGIDSLPAVALVRIEIVKIQQDSAVRPLNYFGNELAVPQLVGAGPEIVDPRLHSEGLASRACVFLDRGDGRQDAGFTLARRQKEAGIAIALPIRRSVTIEAEVLA